MKALLLVLVVASSAVLAWDPLYYENQTSVLPSAGSGGDIALGFFSSSSYWRTDSTGSSELHDLESAISVIRILAAGRYGLTASHTVGILIPAYFQISGSDSTGGGISDPWITLDGWIERSPMIIARGALRIPLKGYLESGDYTESDRHMALDGAVTVETPLSGPGVLLQATGGLRYSFAAWDGLPSFPRDSAQTRPPIEMRGTAFLVMQANPELQVRVGGEFASRGDVSAEIGDDWESLENTGRSSFDLRAGFDLSNQSTDIRGDVYFRLSGENVNKEWGIALTGLGLDFTDLFGFGGSGR
jgi:hypothetical protein